MMPAAREGIAPEPESGPAAAVQAPTIALPKGGGAIRGIGEKFAANPVTGTGSLSVPIAVSPGRSGFGPQLALSYDSGAGNGPFGFGWSLSLPSIARKTDKGLPKYDDLGEDSDVFVLSSVEDLVPVLVDHDGRWMQEPTTRTLSEGSMWKVQRYRPRIEGLFARIERWVDVEKGETHWRSISRDNVTTVYGRTTDSRIADPDDPLRRVFSWLICESYDDRGNAILYRYASEDSVGVDSAQSHERNRTGKGRAANRYLKRIKYGNVSPRQDGEDMSERSDWLFEVVFDYGDHDADAPSASDTGDWLCRPDPFSSYRAGFEVRIYRLCQRVLMFHHFPAEPEVGADCLVRSTDLEYREDAIASFLVSVTQSGYRRRTDGSYLRKWLPKLELEYTEARIDQELREIHPASLENLPSGLDGARFQWVDLDGEGLPGILTDQAEGWFYKRNISPVADGDGGDGSRAAAFAPVELVAEKPSPGELRGGRQQLLDLAGDGQVDLVELGPPLAGFYERTQDAHWVAFVPFDSMPNLAWDDPNLRFVDLTGDGQADILIAEDSVLAWYPSLGEAGFGAAERVSQALDEERGPRLVFADGSDSIYLADISGDGLTDLVRIRNGEVSYWPNLGYGRFGARVSMDAAPRFDSPDLFDQRRIRLADIDGSGTTDIMYLGRDAVRLYFNQAGNSWRAARPLEQLPPIDDVSAVLAVDLLGNGTACLVWSSPLPADAGKPMRYVDLMGGQKPHLLVEVRNNLGAETRVEYVPSTRFCLQDRLAGKPWITRLPFPVHVVERLETYDRISRHRFTTRYAYHHGYFDGIEREFRGFGLVEQLDTEEFAALSAGGVLGPASNVEEASHVPPVLVKTWFHTGAYLDGSRISRQFEADYYHEDDPNEGEPALTAAEAERMLLEDTVLPDTIRLASGMRAPYTLSVEEAQEAARALKGSILRQEIYALDGTDEAGRPYSVAERNYTVEVVQPRGANRHAVFFAHPRETVDFHYERKLFDIDGKKRADPRVTHALTLAVDEFGNVLKSLAAAYGRRYDNPDPPLTLEDRKHQQRTLVTYTESDYTKPIDGNNEHRTPLVCDTRTYELLNLAPSSPIPEITNLFEFGEVLAALDAVGDGQHDLPYEDVQGVGASSGDVYRRLVEHVRVLYRRNDLTGSLPLGRLESLALPFVGYRLAFPDGLLANVYKRGSGNSEETLVPDAVATMSAAGYARSKDLKAGGRFPAADPDDDWWIPSGQFFYSADPSDTFAAELATARAHFFLPRHYDDPFGNTTRVDHAYDLLVQETRDAAGNRVTAGERDLTGALTKTGIDYRVLQPALVMDPNRNRAAAAFDALGFVVATAVMGKPEESIGDSLAGLEPDLAESSTAAHLQGPLADPHSILQRATTRLVYDLFAYQRTRGDPQPQPNLVYTLARETHDSDLGFGQKTKVQHSFSYSDGFGREIQRKIQAEPGALVEAGPQISPRWVGSSWTIFNNKGKPVRQYEPYFSSTHRFEFAKTVGVSSVLFYDPVGRPVVTLHPNHTYETVTFDPWRQQTWDVNDTVLTVDPQDDPDVGAFFRRLPSVEYSPTWYAKRASGGMGVDEQASAVKAAAHARTPSTAFFDVLGRPFLTIAHNGLDQAGTPIRYRTGLELDIEGNQREVFDARGRVVMRLDYDMLGNRVHSASMEAGERWVLNDVAGQPVLAWDSRGHTLRNEYDALRRPTYVYLTAPNGSELLVQGTVYGEMQLDPEKTNLRGKVFRVHDAAGQLTTDDYDFKGNLHRSTRQLATEYKETLDWSNSPPLEAETFTSRTAYDALNRPIELESPDNSTIRPTYNEASLLERLEANVRGSPTVTTVVDDIDYDAKGQRTLLSYGNGTRTEYEYDPETFRLTRLVTTRGASVLQDLRYTYDPVGNITHIEDEAQQTIFFNNRIVSPGADYNYDAIYRLIEATGREHLGQVSGGAIPPTPSLHRGDGNAMGRYREQYSYDEVGNILKLFHESKDPNGSTWRRAYSYGEASLLDASKMSNRLSDTRLNGGALEPHTYDAHGNMTTMPHLPVMRWDYRDRLQATSRQRVVDATPELTYYAYDGAGQRVRKVTEGQAVLDNAPTRMKERVYLGDFEVYREYDGSGAAVTFERETLHVNDNEQRIALIESRTAGTDGSPAQLMRYQFGNHLGSSSLELDSGGQLISYEEYFPFGSTSYQAVRSQTETPKRYRYTGKERDEESALSYHGARYYAPWLGRWTVVDPLPSDRTESLYAYASNRPIDLLDPDGRQVETAEFTNPPRPPPRLPLPSAGAPPVEGTGVLPEAMEPDRWTEPWDSPPPLDPEPVFGEEREREREYQRYIARQNATEMWRWEYLKEKQARVAEQIKKYLPGEEGPPRFSPCSAPCSPVRDPLTPVPFVDPTIDSPPAIDEPEQPTISREAGRSSAENELVKYSGGNRVVEKQGQYWHLPLGASYRQIPKADFVGDVLQEAAWGVAAKWKFQLLNKEEQTAVSKARSSGDASLANLLISQARGRWVERQLRSMFQALQWSSRGPDAYDPRTGLFYEIQSGTLTNLDRHSERRGMTELMWRIISF
jgi:RHS repeat-associated protein